jgi:hypothetical protein
MMFFEMAYDGLNGGTPFELALDLRRDAALLAARVDLELVFGRDVVAAIAGIGDPLPQRCLHRRLRGRTPRVAGQGRRRALGLDYRSA